MNEEALAHLGGAVAPIERNMQIDLFSGDVKIRKEQEGNYFSNKI